MLPTGDREAAVTYILYNDQDLGQNVAGMSDGVRDLCRSQGRCLQQLVRGEFVGWFSWQPATGSFNCCSVCDEVLESTDV